MKIFATAFLSTLVSTSAFVAPNAQRNTNIRMAEGENWDDKFDSGVTMDVKGFEKTGNSEPPKNTPPPAPKKSQALPFMNAPATLDGTLAGDAGFDPLGFAKSKTDLTTYREAEIKHGRLAMLAAAGWPISELMDRKIASLFGLPGVLDESGRVPSVLNGGMDKISVFYWGFCLVLAAGVDVYGLNRASNVKGYTPGDLGFDPLGFYPKDDKGKKWMQTAEIKNGRIAMVAITAFAFQEFASHVAVIDEVPFLFKPFWALGGDPTNAGYVASPDVVENVAAGTRTIFEPDSPLFSESATSAAEATTDAVTSAASDSAPAISDAVSSTAVETTTAVVEQPSVIKPEIEDLASAKQRIAELEAKLSALGVSP